MRTVDDALLRAISDPEAEAGVFLSIGVEIDGLLLWRRFSSQAPEITLGSDSFPGGNTLAEFTPPDRATINTGGGRGGGATVVDPAGEAFERLRDAPIAATSATVDLAFLTEGGWTGGYRLYSGHVGEAAWDTRGELLDVTFASRFEALRARPRFVSNVFQIQRNPTDRSLSQVGRQVYLEWAEIDA